MLQQEKDFTAFGKNFYFSWIIFTVEKDSIRIEKCN
jgi:hypothetical protein